MSRPAVRPPLANPVRVSFELRLLPAFTWVTFDRLVAASHQRSKKLAPSTAVKQLLQFAVDTRFLPDYWPLTSNIDTERVLYIRWNQRGADCRLTEWFGYGKYPTRTDGLRSLVLWWTTQRAPLIDGKLDYSRRVL
jgi:hypothetical protein